MRFLSLIILFVGSSTAAPWNPYYHNYNPYAMYNYYDDGSNDNSYNNNANNDWDSFSSYDNGSRRGGWGRDRFYNDSRLSS